MKKRMLFPILLFMVCCVGMGVYASENNMSLIEWGKYLSGKYATNETSMNLKENSGDVYMSGHSIDVTYQDIEMAEKYYLIGGEKEETARKMAIDYAKKRNSLYASAIENGYSITDNELDKYIKELKTIVSEANNKDEIYSIIDQFDTESDFWNFQKEVYRIDLVIQKYVADLEKKYIDAGGDDWDTEFELLKENLALNQDFKMVQNQEYK